MKNSVAYNQNNNSIGIFDFSRGMLMILVIIGHSINLFIKYLEIEELELWLFPFLLIVKALFYVPIPMFFIMSGYSFRPQKMKMSIRKRVRYISKPYIGVAVCVTILAVIKKILQKESVIDALKYQTFPFLLGLCPGETDIFGWYTASIGPLWFLVVLGISGIVLNTIFRLKDEILRFICVIVLVSFCVRLPFASFIPFCVVQSLTCLGYLYIGYCIQKENALFKEISKSSYIVLVLISLLVIGFGNIEVSQNVWKLGFLDYSASCIAGFLMLRIFLKIGYVKNVLTKIIKRIGKNSFNILCVHTIEYLVFPWDIVAFKVSGHMLIGIITVVILRTVFIIIVCDVLKKTKKIKSDIKKQKKQKNQVL